MRVVARSRPGGVKGTALIQERSKRATRNETMAGARISAAARRSSSAGMNATVRSKMIRRSKFSSNVATWAPRSWIARTKSRVAEPDRALC